MPTLLEKMEANAATRLVLPAGTPPVQELARFKNFLKVENHRLKLLHRGGAAGREICQARAAMMDVLLRYIVEAIQKNIPPDKNSANWGLVAIGGYGRGELNPHSDIDFMFLHDGSLVSHGKPVMYLKALTDGKGPEVIYDPVGGEYTEPAFRSIAWRGRYLVVGFAAGPIPALPFNLMLLKGASVVGVFWGDFAKKEPKANAAMMAELATWYAKGTIKPVIDSTMPMSELKQAYAHMSSRAVKGKLVMVNGEN